MKKNDVLQGRVTRLVYPSLGMVPVGQHEVAIKGALPDQTLEFRVSKNRRTSKEGKVLSVLERAPYEVDSFCEHFGSCGGCARQTVPYREQLKLKQGAVQALLDGAGFQNPILIESIIPSPNIYEYRNKMEYSFGNEQKGGILNLGMHKKGRFYDVVSIPNCHLIDSDFRDIITAIETLVREQDWAYFNRNTGEGIVRHVVVRKSPITQEILVGISTAADAGVEGAEGGSDAKDAGNAGDAGDAGGPVYTNKPSIFNETLFVERLKALSLKGKIVGILRLINSDPGDVVKQGPKDRVLFGRDYYTEKLFDLTFKVSFFSFFQTNTLGAELLYKKALGMLDGLHGKTVFDLFSGTGTIGQIAAEQAKQVVGIEIVADAVEAARENARANGLDNCEFIAGDVFQVLESIDHLPDTIIIDPPRAGMSPKTVDKIGSYGVSQILYVSCNPKTMVENLVQFESLGYTASHATLVDLYPHTDHVECVVLLQLK